MDLLQRLIALLGRLGFNTTRLKWKLFQMEKRMKQPNFGARLPTSMQWLTYPHKRCRHCNGIVDRDARNCEHCGKRAPSMFGYRAMRLLGIAAPQGSPIMLGAFVLLILINFGLSIAMQGWSALWSPTNTTLTVLGAWTPLLAIVREETWRYLAFGIAHIGVIHIAFNLLELIQVGPIIEERIDPWRMLVAPALAASIIAIGIGVEPSYLLQASARATAHLFGVTP